MADPLDRTVIDYPLELDDSPEVTVASAAEARHTGGMVALVPSDTDRERLAVDGGELSEHLHLTLTFLGDDVTQLEPETRESIIATVKRYANNPVTAEAFAVNIFNPTKTNADGTPGGCVVLGVGNDDGTLHELRSNVVSALGGLGGFELPEQHTPWVPHVTLAYTDKFARFTEEALTRVGPITFDTLRVALAGDDVDIPLGEPEIITADYNPRQPRSDNTGRWIKTPGGSGVTNVSDLSKRLRKARDGRSALKSAASIEEISKSKPLVGAAAQYYQGDSQRINQPLRRGQESTLPHRSLVTTQTLDANMIPLADDVKVYRSIMSPVSVFGGAWHPTDNTGLTWEDDAFVSTTVDEKIAQVLLRRGTGNGVVMTMLAPRGTPALRVDVGQFKDEKEILLGRRNRYRVVSDDGVKNGIRYLTVEVIPVGHVPITAAASNAHGDDDEGERQGVDEKSHRLVDAGPEVRVTRAAGQDLADDVSREFAQERDVNEPGGGSGHQLRDYWTRGPGAAKIRWGTDGSFNRCVTQLGKYVKNPQGLCAEYHKRATGEWPAEKGVESAMTETAAGDTGGAPAPTKTKDKTKECPPGHHQMPDGTCMSDADMYDYVVRERFGIETVAAAPEGAADEPWEGPLVVEGVESGDSRLFNLGSLDWADLPMPLQYQPTSIGGHNGSITVGEITNAARRKNQVYGWGNVFGTALAGEHGEGIRNTMKVGGVSVDVDKVKDADVELVYATDDGHGTPFDKPVLTIFNRGRIRGATLVAFPAFVEAKLRFTGDAEEVVTASVNHTDCGCDTGAGLNIATHEVPEVLVASAHTITIPNLPPANWFNEPTDVKVGGALTITDEGRVYAIVAPAGVTHRNRPVKVPRNLDFSRFMKGETIVEGGGRVVTGVITGDCGHAPTSNYGTLDNRIDHYDNSCSVLANIRVGYGRDGHIWAAGALNPGAKPEQVAQALGCALSLDVQPHPDRPGTQEFISAHLVPVAGFPLARTHASVTYEDGLITASSVPVRHAEAEYVDPLVAAGAELVELTKRALVSRVGLDPRAIKRSISERLGI